MGEGSEPVAIDPFALRIAFPCRLPRDAGRALGARLVASQLTKAARLAVAFQQR
jgi:hypothetical protein